MPVQEAMQGTGSSVGNTMNMGGQHARLGAPNLPTQQAANMAAMNMAARKHFVTPAGDYNNENRRNDDGRGRKNIPDLPYYYNNNDDSSYPVPYAAPSEQKENMLVRSAVRDAAAAENQRNPDGVMRTDPITDEEVNYVKSMAAMAEVAKFDDYVESFIDPRQPGNMKWLMNVYPEYVERRLQQAHTDYEYALRNQMIDMWGINTPEDLMFKYMVDQGQITGPALRNERPKLDYSYTPGVLSVFNFQKPGAASNQLRLPFASAKHGKRPEGGVDSWSIDRTGRPLGSGNTYGELAQGMYNTQQRPRDGIPGSLSGTPTIAGTGTQAAGGTGFIRSAMRPNAGMRA